MLGLASLGSVMVALDVLVVAAALTTIRADLGAGGYGGDGLTRGLAGCGVLSLLGALAGLGITARRGTGGAVVPRAMEEVR